MRYLAALVLVSACARAPESAVLVNESDGLLYAAVSLEHYQRSIGADDVDAVLRLVESGLLFEVPSGAVVDVLERRHGAIRFRWKDRVGWTRERFAK